MDDFPFPEETDGIADLRIFDQTKDVVISGAGLLFGSHVFMEIRDGIPFGLKIGGRPGGTGGRLGAARSTSGCM